MLIGILMDEMQPVVLENKRFDTQEKRKLLAFLAFSVIKVSDVRKVPKKLFSNEA